MTKSRLDPNALQRISVGRKQTAATTRLPLAWRLRLVLGAVLALILSWQMRGVASADPVKGEVSADLSGGYARIVFHFAQEVEANLRLANSILIINFKTPVTVPLDRLEASAADYIGAARRDPDGKGIRLALAQNVRVHSMTAAERLFVDLLPESWTGPPPALPQDIVEELARRTREAERKLQRQRELLRAQRAHPIRVRVAHQPTFSRYVFELPELMAVDAQREKDRLTLIFEQPLKFDLADAKVSLPPMVESIEAKTDEETARVSFAFLGKVDVRSFREDNNFVVDVAPAQARSDNADLLPAALVSLVAPQRQSGAASPAHSNAVPAAAAPPTGPAPSAVPAKAAGSGTRAQEQARGGAMPLPEAEGAAPAPAPRAGGVQAPPQPGTDGRGGNQDASAPAATPAEPMATAAPIAGEAAGAKGQRDPQAAVAVELQRQGESWRLTFPFATPTAAAVFRRADVLWLVFDTGDPIDLAALERDGTHSLRVTTVIRTRASQVVRIKLARPLLASLSAAGTAWILTLGDTVSEPTRPLAVTRHVATAAQPTAIIPLGAPSRVHRLSDPDAGDTLWVITALGPARGFLQSQDFVEFHVLASTHGVAIAPLADDLSVERAGDKVVVSRPGGLALSTSAPVGRRLGVYRPRAFDAQLWGFDREAAFVDRRDKLIAAAAAAPEGKRHAARMALARFYLAREMYAEAKAVLDVALAEQRPTAEDATGLVMRAVANIMLGRPDEALKDLAHPLVGNQDEAPLWRAVAAARQGKWREAREGFSTVTAALATLPVELQRLVMLDAARAAIETGDLGTATKHLNEFDILGVPHELEPAIALLRGRLAEGLGHHEEALAAYRAAAESSDRPVAAQARLREIALRYRLKELQRADVITALETLTTIWRGDETEVEALHLLARLYTEESRYRDAFTVMRTALYAHPNSDIARRLHDEAAETFEALFLFGKGDAMPAIEALSLFYDFRELTPLGRRGDEMIRRLSDRLVAVDLLDQAAELLQHQVDHRLQGAARAQVAARLAVIYLMNRKPDRALAALRATRTGELPNEIRNMRLLLEARALSDIGQHDLALEVIAHVPGREALRLSADIFWAAKRWREAAEQIELLYGERWREWRPLEATERADLLRAAVGYALADDRLGLDRFRRRYAAKMAEGPDAQAFEIATSPESVVSPPFRDLARRIAAADTLDAFLRAMRARYPETDAFSASRPPAARLSAADTTGSLARRAPAPAPEPAHIP